MPRKILVQTDVNSTHLLEETTAADEEQLRELVNSNPDLLPVEEFGVAGPLMIVGRETLLASGAIDLVGLSRSGHLIVVEFKTGTQNSDFRKSLAQLLDYGSDLWNMSYEEFESAVAVRYFTSPHCREQLTLGKTSLAVAAQAVWPDFSEDEASRLRDELSDHLAKGSFIYVLAAANFAPASMRTIEYLNALGSIAQFYAVEVLPFVGGGLSAFESRTLIKPAKAVIQNRTSQTDENQFLGEIEDERYRETLRQLFEATRGLGFHVSWGSVGASIRVDTSDRPEPLSIAWVFPPGRSGWYGLTDLTLGVDIGSGATQHPSVQAAIEQYIESIGKLAGAQAVKPKGLQGFHFNPEATMGAIGEVIGLFASLAQQVSAE